MTINFEEFEKTYKPIKNTLVENAAIYEYMFETYDKELDKIQSSSTSNIWTYINSENKNYIINGYHYANRLGYLLTEVSFDRDLEITVTFNATNNKLDILDNNVEIGNIIIFNPPKYKGLVVGTCIGFTKVGLPKVTMLPKYNNITFKLHNYNVNGYYVPKTGFAVINKTIQNDR